MFGLYLSRFSSKHLFDQQEGSLVLASFDNVTINEERDIKLFEFVARGNFGSVWKGKYRKEIVAVKIFTMQDKVTGFEIILIYDF